MRVKREAAGSRVKRNAARFALLLYLLTLGTDAARKITGISNSSFGLVYAVVGVIYVLFLPRIAGRNRLASRSLPLMLVLLSIWCAAEAITEKVPAGIAVLGWATYVFFVPLYYIGAELTAEDDLAAKVLSVVVVAGGLVGLGTIASAALGNSAPALLKPIIPVVGIHSSDSGSIYLAPSIFATSERASEQLLIAFFAWIALSQLPSGRLGRKTMAILAALIVGGVIYSARRAEVLVDVLGVIALLVVGHVYPESGTGQPVARANSARRGGAGAVLALAVIGAIGLAFMLNAGSLLPFLASGSPGSRVSLMFSVSDPYSLTGQGTGTGTQGATMVGTALVMGSDGQTIVGGSTLSGRIFMTVEGGLTKTWLELGLIGVVLYAGVFISVLGPAVRSLRALDGAGRALLVLVMALGVIFLKGHQSLDDPLVQPLFWLTAGGVWGRMRATAASRAGSERGRGIGPLVRSAGPWPERRSVADRSIHQPTARLASPSAQADLDH